MINIIFGGIVIVLFTSACVYIYKEKKKGTKCIGCPLAGKADCHCPH